MRTSIERGWNERTVKVSKTKLLAKLLENREKHQREYQQAMEGYVEMATEKLERKHAQALERLSARFEYLKNNLRQPRPDDEEQGAVITLVDRHYIELEVPQNHTKDYDVAIEMARWSEDEVIEITQSQLQCFILDDWEWKDEWSKLSSYYTSNMKGR